MRVYQFRHVGIAQILLRNRYYNSNQNLVPTEGLEPPHLAAHGPEPCASTNSATWALHLLFAALLDVAVEFRYDIRLCRFAPDQLSFAFHRAATDSHRFVAGWAVFEESESIADQLQMSKGHEAISSGPLACLPPDPPAARFTGPVRRIPASSVTLRVKTCQSNHCADYRPTSWLNKIKKTI